MKLITYLRDAAVFAPCYLLLDWASYFDPMGPFNITPWNPQPALAIVWMMLGGLSHAPAVLATIALADLVIRQAPGGLLVTVATATVLTTGYMGIAWLLRRWLDGTAMRSTRELTAFITIVTLSAAVVGLAFVGTLRGSGMLREAPFAEAWARFWVGDAVGILVTAPLLFAAADPQRRRGLLELFRDPEALVQFGALSATVWLIFKGLGTDPSRHFYLLFLPLIWTAVRFGMNGAIAATAAAQLGVVIGIHSEAGRTLPVLELQALMAALTLTGFFLGVVVDQRERAEAGLRRSLHLAAAGEMAGAIAHEVNQPLTALSNYGRSAGMLLAKGAPDAATLRAIIDKILGEAERASDVVRRLRDFFRAGTTRLEEVSPDELLAAIRAIGRACIRDAAISLEVEMREPLRPLVIDRLQVEVVLRNLIANAVESLVASRLAEGRIRVTAEMAGTEHVRIVVADDGPGIAPAARERLFEPFVSGKPTGMGFGLAVSRAIAEAHGGTLEAAEGGHGEFHLTLPCHTAA